MMTTGGICCIHEQFWRRKIFLFAFLKTTKVFKMNYSCDWVKIVCTDHDITNVKVFTHHIMPSGYETTKHFSLKTFYAYSWSKECFLPKASML